VRVELLHHPGCRSAPAVYRLVQDCLTVLAIPTDVHVRVGAYPSPTVRIDGTDVVDPSRAWAHVPTRRADPGRPAGRIGRSPCHPAY
jgi:hypothetical protein